MRQLYLAHAALFACAYVGFLGYFALTDPNDPVARRLGARSERPAVSYAPPPLKAASTHAPAEQETVPATAMQDEEQGQEPTRLSEVRTQAVRADEPQQRAEAIDQLHTAEAETLQTLQAVVTSDSSARNRIRAVNSLRSLAEREGAREAVLPILSLAMSDADSGVAARAAEAYRDLTREPAPTE